jgi:hypothetical protein
MTPAHRVTARLRELLEKATHGPWYLQPDDGPHLGRIVCGGPDATYICEMQGSMRNVEVRADANLIAEGCNALPALLAVAEAAERAVAPLDSIEHNAALSVLRVRLEELGKEGP